jgi:hypothetical protein
VRMRRQEIAARERRGSSPCPEPLKRQSDSPPR